MDGPDRLRSDGTFDTDIFTLSNLTIVGNSDDQLDDINDAIELFRSGEAGRILINMTS